MKKNPLINWLWKIPEGKKKKWCIIAMISESLM